MEEIVYHSPTSDYTVITVSDKNGDLDTAVGDLPYVCVGETVKLYGRWGSHSEYGKQFEADSFEKLLPTDVSSILSYLSAGNIKGIGPITARKIVDKYREDTFDVIENHPEWLAEIPGISRKKAADIATSFAEQAEVRSIMMLCGGHLNSGAVGRVYQKFGKSAVAIVKADPYKLCDQGLGIGFEAADTLAMSLGVGKDFDTRIRSGIIYVLEQSAQMGGHVCMPKDRLIGAVTARLEIEEDKVRDALADSLELGTVVEYMHEDREYIFTKRYFEEERYVCKKLVSLDRFCAVFEHKDIDVLIDKIENQNAIRYAKMQRRAISEVLRSGVMVITGGPGTGKTTIVKALISIFKSVGMKVALAAPTGRAAKRMSEATSEEAKTIHRMLEMEKDISSLPKFNKNEKNLLDEDVIIVDEASMIDITLMDALLRAIKGGSRLVLIGDADQLPSVGCGNVLNDIISSDQFNTVCLDEIFRQSEDSLIVVNAHRINNGSLPVMDKKTGDFFHIEREDGSIATTISSLITKRLPKTYGSDVVDKLQVITPSRKGEAGTEALNYLLREAVNPRDEKKTEIKIGNTLFRERDKVMQIKNNYDIAWTKGAYDGSGVFNGDIGVIEEINRHEQKVYIAYDDRLAEYDFSQLDELEHAYAITVHKSQGSEYPVVIIPLYSCSPMLMTRNLIYTAVTRAKEMVILVGHADVMRIMVDNDRHVMRYTMLRDRLIDEINS
ncbi:MAG: ATP-dependent RecD-like DNA helicase [Clostridia bacterium]|nr:ATP-dependent RecD-like DNA helicase [Clostridia bacterium]